MPAPKPSAKPRAEPEPVRPARKRGHPKHVPTDATRRRVIAWSGGGIEQAMIALSLPNPTRKNPKKLGISVDTLFKHYGSELAIGKAMMDGLAVSALGTAMQQGGKEAVAAAKWWTQSRMGWTEKIIVDDGRADTPLRVIVELVGEAPPKVEQSARQAGPRLSEEIRKNVQLVG